MSLLSALEDQENKLDHGWSRTNRFSNEITNSQPGSEIDNWPQSELQEENYHNTESPPLPQIWPESSKRTENWQRIERPAAIEEWQEDSLETRENWYHRDRQETAENWHQVDSPETSEDWEDAEERETAEDWDPEDSPETSEDWEHTERGETTEDWHHEDSTETRENWHHTETREETENWQQEESPETREDWQSKDSPESTEDWEHAESPEPSENWHHTGTPELAENWQHKESQDPPEDWPHKESPDPTEDWHHKKSSDPTEDWQDTESPHRTENWENSETREATEDWPQTEEREDSPQSELSSTDDWPEIDLPEPVEEDNRQPIIQEIREQEIVCVPSSIINSTPGTPQATVVSTSKGQSILVHSEGDKYIFVSPSNKQSSQTTTQLITLPSKTTLHDLLSKRDNPQNFQQRPINPQQRIPTQNRSVQESFNAQRLKIVQSAPRILSHPKVHASYVVTPNVSPTKGNQQAYYLASLSRGRGRGRGSRTPSNRGNNSYRGRGNNTNRGRGSNNYTRIPVRGRGRQQSDHFNQVIPGHQYSNRGNRFPTPSPSQIFHPNSGPAPRIIRYTVARTPGLGINKPLQVVASISGEKTSHTLTSSSEHSIHQAQDTLSSVEDSTESTSQSVALSQMIVDHEYAAPDPTNDASDNSVNDSNQQSAVLKESKSLESGQDNSLGFTDGCKQNTSELNQSSNNSVNSDRQIQPSPCQKNTSALGGGQLEKNTVYLIKSPDGLERMMIWNGERFQDYDSKTYTITSDVPGNMSGSDVPVAPGNMSGGGVGEGNRGKQIRGNATGLHMIQNRSNSTSLIVRPGNPPTATTKSDNSNRSVRNDILPNGRTWKYATSPPRDSLARRPLHSESEKGGGITTIIVGSSPDKPKSITVVNESSASSHESSSTPDLERNNQDQDAQSDESNKRKRLEESGCREGECVVHCKYCGYSSSNVLYCDRCHRAFPDDVKIEPLTKKGRTCVNEDEKPQIAIDKKTFYGQKLSEQSQAYQTTKIVQLSNEGETQTGRRINVGGKSFRMVRLTSAPSRKKPMAPVTVTISSDEEEEVFSRPASVGSSGAADEADSLSQVMADIPNTKPASPKFNTSRVKKMEDEMGNQILRKIAKKNTIPNINIVPVNRPKIEKPNHVIPNDLQMSGQQLTLNARSIRIGSLRGVPIEPVLVSSEGVFLFFECEDNSHKITIQPQDVVQCLVCIKKDAVIFLHTTAEFGQMLRSQLGMREDNPGPYFDPQHSDMKHQFITLLLQDNSVTGLHQKLFDIISQYCNSNEEKKKDFICTLSPEEAQDILIKTSPEGKIITNVLPHSIKSNTVIENQMEVMKNPEGSQAKLIPLTQESQPEARERSPSPKIMFSGPIKKLITFPPRPATGGIAVTNEDLFCLTEGEFLNDVIIDFYLKYLLLERLSEEDRKRTHIFSSFFFKRLTQRHAPRPEDAALTPAEKRHARVRTWTKHVDLFKKDFIIVPINEHSHWFLAIICFPGKLQNECVTFIPKNRLLDTSTQLNNSQLNVVRQENSESEKTEETTEPEKQEVQGSEGQEEEQAQQQQQQPMEDCGDNQPKENQPTEAMELEPGEVPMDTSNTEVTRILPAKYFTKESRGRLVTQEEIADPNIAKMAVTGQRQPCIMVFDSLSGVSRSRIVNILKEYLQVEWSKKKDVDLNLKERLRGGSPKVPQQTNYSDCGVYVLQYVESFFEDPVQDFSLPMKSLQNWFTGERIRRKREEIKELIMTISELQNKS